MGEVDSSKRESHTLDKKDVNHLEIVEQLQKYSAFENDKLEHKVKESAQFALDSSDMELLIKVYKTAGNIYDKRQDYSRSVKYYNKVIETAEQIDDNEEKIQGLYNIGLAYWNCGEYDSSEKYFVAAEETAKLIKKPELLALVNKGLGQLNWKLGKFDTALDYYNTALTYCHTEKSATIKVHLHNYIGVIYKNQGNIRQALKEFQTAYELAEELSYLPIMSLLLNNIGNINLYLGNHQAAIDNYLKALSTLDENANQQTQATILNNIGLIYLNMNEIEQSIPYFRDSMKIRENQPDHSAFAQSLKNLGIALHKKGDIILAKEYFNRALKIELESKNKVGLATTYSLIGLINLQAKEYKKALRNYRNSLQLYEEIGDKTGIAADFINLGSIYIYQEKYGEAKILLDKGLNLAEKTEVENLIRDAHKTLSELFERQGDFKQAFKHYVEYDKVRGKMESLESKKQIANLRAKYELEQQEKEAEIHKLKNIELAKANFELKQLKENLEKQISESVEEIRKKDTLMITQARLAEMGKMIGFIAHQWKQPLNSVGVIAQSIEDAYNFNELDDALVIDSTAEILKQIEYMSATIDNFRNYFKPQIKNTLFDARNVIENTIGLLKQSFNDNHIVIEISLGEDCIVSGIPNELSQVIMNLLNNARDALEMHGDINNKVINLSLSRCDEEVIIEITDNAGGVKKEALPHIFEPYFTTKSENKGTGLGLYMSKTIIEDKFKGKLEASNIHNGANFKITLPAN